MLNKKPNVFRLKYDSFSLEQRVSFVENDIKKWKKYLKKLKKTKYSVIDIGSGNLASIIALIELDMLKEGLVFEPVLERWYKALKKLGYTKEYFQNKNVTVLRKKYSNSLLESANFIPTLMIKTFNNWVLWSEINLPPKNCVFISNEDHDKFLRDRQKPSHAFSSGVTIYKT